MKKYFHNLTKPKADELFSSWLRRAAASRFNQSILAAKKLLVCRGLHTHDDCPPADILTALSSLLGVSVYQLKCLYLPEGGWTHKPTNRRHYCEYCVLDDIAAGHGPIIRKRWAYYWYVACEIHSVPLTYLPQPTIFTSSEIVNSMIKKHADFYLLINSYYAHRSPWTTKARGTRRWCLYGLIHVACASQHAFFRQLNQRTWTEDTVKFTEVVEVLNLLSSICARKQIKPYESKTFVASVVRSVRASSCYFSSDSGALLSETLDVDLSLADPGIRVATVAVLGIILGVSRCAVLWDFFISSNYSELNAFDHITSALVKSVVLSSEFCDYKGTIKCLISRCSHDTQVLFRDL